MTRSNAETTISRIRVNAIYAARRNEQKRRLRLDACRVAQPWRTIPASLSAAFCLLAGGWRLDPWVFGFGLLLAISVALTVMQRRAAIRLGEWP